MIGKYADSNMAKYEAKIAWLEAKVKQLEKDAEHMIDIMDKSNDPITRFASAMCQGKKARLSIRDDGINVQVDP